MIGKVSDLVGLSLSFSHLGFFCLLYLILNLDLIWSLKPKFVALILNLEFLGASDVDEQMGCP